MDAPRSCAPRNISARQKSSAPPSWSSVTSGTIRGAMLAQQQPRPVTVAGAGYSSPYPLAEDAAERLRAMAEKPEPPPHGHFRRIRRFIPASFVPRARELLTDALRPLARHRVARVRRQSTIRLHLGCGLTYKNGWTNLDLAPVKVDIPWNLKHGIPFADDSVDCILHEHLLEHLTLADGYSLTRECLRVLKADGVLRIGVPDAGLCLASYAGHADPDWARSAPTPMLSVTRLFYEHGHRSMYDGQTLALLCRAAGFPSPELHDSGGGLLGGSDSSDRREGTLYVEAVKPTLTGRAPTVSGAVAPQVSPRQASGGRASGVAGGIPSSTEALK